jgi:phage I-like protein
MSDALRFNHPVTRALAEGRLWPSELTWAYSIHHQDPTAFAAAVDRVRPGTKSLSRADHTTRRSETAALAKAMNVPYPEAPEEVRDFMRETGPEGEAA